ncbi:integrase [Gossypium australe]|uniref:Integrase n=1 Tax=Gossypium australe TaxID=47621 RepID=A0A5B6WRZ4_9ROSI|nr:integrase [Gossypium australe]
MKRDISDFVSNCLVCQQVEAKHQVPSRLLQPILIPEWKWDRVTMDIVSGLPLTLRKKDAIWVIVDRLTKSTHFIPVRSDFSLDRLTELYIFEIVRLHGKLQEALGTKLFEIGDKVFLKVSPRKKVLRFERKTKLSPRFIR